MISIRPALSWLLVLFMLALISGCDRAPAPTATPAPSPATAAPVSKELPHTASTFTGAKKALYDQVYFDHRITFYCGCAYSTGREIDLGSCGLETLADKPRARQIEAEHIFPAAMFGNFRACWRTPKDFPECVKSGGKTVSGRECCQRVDPVFESAHNDLMNLVPSVGEVNGRRSDYGWGMIPGEKRDYGRCTIEIDASLRRAEPPENVMGDIARTMFYMSDTYRFNLSRQDDQLYTAWSRQDPPDAWEIERNRRIKAIQGKGNRFVEDYAAIFGKTAAAPAKLPTAPVPNVPATASGGFSCGGKRYCREMSSCEEAKFYLTQCRVGSLDGNKDGVPCESLCR